MSAGEDSRANVLSPITEEDRTKDGRYVEVSAKRTEMNRTECNNSSSGKGNNSQ